MITTSMKKVEVYAALDSCENVTTYLESEKLYWYKELVEMGGSGRVCRVTFYAPVHALVGILEGLAGVLDLRRRENTVIVVDVETGIGRPYKTTGRRFRQLARGLLARPLPALQEEAVEKSSLYPAQVLLVALAGIIALAGLANNNPYVIIGAMLISPILAPIYSFSVAVNLGDERTALRSIGTLTILLALAFTSTLIVSLAAEAAGAPLGATRELLLRTRASLSDLLLAMLLGAASVVAVSSNVTEALTGVAIAAAIVPPSATLGWSVAANPALAPGSLELIMYNVAGLLAGGTLTIRVLLAVGKQS